MRSVQWGHFYDRELSAERGDVTAHRDRAVDGTPGTQLSALTESPLVSRTALPWLCLSDGLPLSTGSLSRREQSFLGMWGGI